MHFFFSLLKGLDQLCPTLGFGSWAACGPVKGFVRPTLGFHSSNSFLYTDNLFYFDNLEFDIFDAGDLQCHFITPDTATVKICTLSIH